MFKKTLLCIFIAFSLLSLSSCVTGVILIGAAIVAAGGTYYYLDGNYMVELPDNTREVYSATLKYMQTSSKYRIKENNFTNGIGYVEVESKSDGELVGIDIKSKSTSENITTVKIRYGLMGNEKASGEIADGISGNLPKKDNSAL
jgi:outer membrane protease